MRAAEQTRSPDTPGLASQHAALLSSRLMWLALLPTIFMGRTLQAPRLLHFSTILYSDLAMRTPDYISDTSELPLFWFIRLSPLTWMGKYLRAELLDPYTVSTLVCLLHHRRNHGSVAHILSGYRQKTSTGSEKSAA